MSKIFTILFILITVSFLHSYTIEETLSQIKSLKKEIEHNEILVEEKIAELNQNNPLFAEQDVFESDVEYLTRMSKAMPQIDRLRKQYLSDLWQKMSILRGRLFETKNIQIDLDTKNYDSNTEKWHVTVQHLQFQQESKHMTLDISKNDASDLYKNWDKVKKTGILAIDVGDKIGLAKLILENPITSFKLEYEFRPMKSFKHNIYVKSVAFSSDGKFLATGCGYRGYYSDGKDGVGDARIFNLETGNEVKSFKHNKAVYSVAFSPDGKFLTTGGQDKNARIFNLETGNEVKSFKHGNDVNSITFSPDGKFLATGCVDKFAYLYRTLFQVEEEVLTQKTISRPPSLTASVNFEEPGGNLFLDALETGVFKVTITNNGAGDGKGILVKIDPERIDNLNYNNTYIGQIEPGKSVTVEIPTEAYIGIADADHTFSFNFYEINGFPPAPVEIQISTKSYEKPEMFIADVGIKDSNEDGKIESGEMIEITLRFANNGKGLASGSYAKFYTGNDVFITDTYPKTVKLGDLEYGEFVDIPLEFFVNDRTKEEIPLFVDITEATGLATVNKLRLPILKSDKTREIRRTVVTGIDKKYGDLEFEEDLSIDIEQNIPQTSKTNKNALAIIFGIEDYKNVSDVSFAHRDANFVKEYFEKTLGINNSNIYFKTNENVTKAEFDKVFSKDGWLDKRVKQGKTEIYFYYAGHGAPEIKQNKAYLIPYDGDPNYASQTGYEMDEIYANLADLKAKSVTVFLDACFSGANRENEMLLANARPIMIEVEGPAIHGITVFSATSGKEISSAWPEKKHGLFTYFLLKGFQGNADINANKQITIGELKNYILQNVSETAGFLDREQTPTFTYEDKERVLIEYE